jgi:hypothetical protein
VTGRCQTPRGVSAATLTVRVGSVSSIQETMVTPPGATTTRGDQIG